METESLLASSKSDKVRTIPWCQMGILLVVSLLLLVFIKALLAAKPHVIERPQTSIVALGDSLTQFGDRVDTKGWVSSLRYAYIRKADVLNRGFSGANTHALLSILSFILPDQQKQLLTIIMLGTNDARVSSEQIPIDEYTNNLKKMVQRAMNAGACLLLTPPPW